MKHLECVMFVDDDPDDNYLHSLVLEDMGLNPKVVIAESGGEALEYLENSKDKAFKKPDIIFLDINMPGIDGFEFLKRHAGLSNDITENTKIVMLTTSSHPFDKERVTAIRSDVSYKTKPLTMSDLAEVLTT